MLPVPLSGATFVYTREDFTHGWSLRCQLQTSDDAPNMYVGKMVAVYGSTVITSKTSSENFAGTNL